MRRSLLDLICCPVCHGVFGLEVFVEASEIEEGRLTCQRCSRVFPIINGIPRLLPDPLAHLSPPYHRDFFQRYAQPMAPFLARCAQPQQDRWWQAERRTLKSYSYQWRTFKQMLPHWEQIFRDSIHPIDPAFFRGKVGLDAGCGFGRSLHYAATYGAEVIGMDLSEAVEAARENTRQLPTIHLIQGDIFHPPIADHSLDFVYSIGVLHHLPKPKQGLLRLTHLVRPGSPIFIWMYSRGRGRQIAFLTLLRALTTRLPYRLLHGVSLGCAALQWGCWILPYRLLNRFALTRPLAQRLPFTFHARYPFSVLHTDWFDGLSVPLQEYYRREEVEAWLHEAELERITMDPAWGQVGGGGRALGYAPAEVGATEVVR
ncbi:MAG: methyltransferase domain-containing protein [Candidatus Omnitrophica bacterium]|nr:methyltransferase domain-containing protein [Candidatus Omnitrophota bacterium]MBI3021870.1 methyltransferase domain-containing protein [Candidatus Omnitrophota bacterium]